MAPRYWQIPYWWLPAPWNVFAPLSQYSQRSHSHSWTWSGRGELEQPDAWIPSWVPPRQPLPSWLGSDFTVSFLRFTESYVSLHFRAFCWWFHCINGPKPRAEVLSRVLGTRRLWCALQRKFKGNSISQSWIIVLLAVSSMLMNQRYILNQVSRNRNTRKTRLCIDPLAKPGD